MRITHSTIMRQYNNRLNTVLSNLNTANQKVSAQRKFLKGSEDPSASVRARRLYREYQKNEHFIENVKNTAGRFDSAESTMMNISKLCEDIYVDLVSVRNGTYTDDDRLIYASKIREAQKEMVMELNAKFGDRFLFGGSSVKEAPFTLEDDGTVRFRGLDVNDPANLAQLQEMADEKIYIDFGFGMTIDESAAEPNTVLRGSAFDVALPGINLVGFGTDANGFSNNLISTLGELADLLEQNTLDRDQFNEVAGKFDEQRIDVLVNVTQLGTNSTFLNFTLKRLDDNQYNLSTRLNDLVYLDPAKAITDFQSQLFVYNAALKMGNSIMTPSFIDFMK